MPSPWSPRCPWPCPREQTKSWGWQGSMCLGWPGLSAATQPSCRPPVNIPKEPPGGAGHLGKLGRGAGQSGVKRFCALSPSGVASYVTTNTAGSHSQLPFLPR